MTASDLRNHRNAAWIGAVSVGLVLLTVKCGQSRRAQPDEAAGGGRGAPTIVAVHDRRSSVSAAACPFVSDTPWDSMCVELRVKMEHVYVGGRWRGGMEIVNDCDIAVAVVTSPVLTLADTSEIMKLPLPLGFTGSAARFFVLPRSADIPTILNRGGRLLHGGVEVRGCPRYATAGPRSSVVVPISGAPEELRELPAGEYLPVLMTYGAPASAARQASPLDLGRSPRLHNQRNAEEEPLRVGSAVVQLGTTVRPFRIEDRAARRNIIVGTEAAGTLFAGFDPWKADVLVLTANRFWPTLLSEAVVVLLAIRRRRLSAREGGLARRLRDRAVRAYAGRSVFEGEAASLWAVPLLVWSLQAVCVMDRALAYAFMGLVELGPEYVWEALYTVGLALVVLIFVQAGAVVAAEGWRTDHLGLAGPWRVAVQFAIASAVLNSFLRVVDYGVFIR